MAELSLLLCCLRVGENNLPSTPFKIYTEFNKKCAFFFLHVSGGSDKTHKVLRPFSAVDVRGPQAFQAVWRAKDVTVEDYMIGRLLLSATDAFGCI